jgi:hypothetical protein
MTIVSKLSILEQDHERLHRYARINYDQSVSAKKASSVAAPTLTAPVSMMRREEVRG